MKTSRVIFLHGYLGSPEDWLPLISFLPKTFTCYPIDLNQYLLPSLSLKEGLSKLKKAIPSPALCIGYSMGGRLALLLAYFYPGCFDQLILLAANPGIDADIKSSAIQERKAKELQWIQMIKKEGKEKFLDAWYEQPLFASLKKHPLFPKVLERRRKQCLEQMIHHLKEFSPTNHPSLWPFLSTLSYPTLFLFGKEDVTFLPIAERLRHNYKNVQVEILPNCGHALPIENPKTCAEKIVRFMEKSKK